MLGRYMLNMYEASRFVFVPAIRAIRGINAVSAGLHRRGTMGGEGGAKRAVGGERGGVLS